jgi:hypothetical protein
MTMTKRKLFPDGPIPFCFETFVFRSTCPTKFAWTCVTTPSAAATACRERCRKTLRDEDEDEDDDEWEPVPRLGPA